MKNIYTKYEVEAMKSRIHSSESSSAREFDMFLGIKYETKQTIDIVLYAWYLNGEACA